MKHSSVVDLAKVPLITGGLTTFTTVLDQCFVQPREWARYPACHFIEANNRKQEAYATFGTTQNIKLEKALLLYNSIAHPLIALSRTPIGQPFAQA